MIAPAEFALATFDQPPAAVLDPAIWSQNLAALDAVDAAFAAQLRAQAPPSDRFRAVLALDGATTFQELREGVWAWWTGTAVPRARAAGLFPPRPEQKAAVLLCELGTAADLAAVLQAYSPEVRVFGAARRWVDFSAALQITNFTAELASRRFWPLPPGDEPRALAALPHDVPPPLTLLRVPFGDELKFEELQTACADAWRLRS